MQKRYQTNTDRAHKQQITAPSFRMAALTVRNKKSLEPEVTRLVAGANKVAHVHVVCPAEALTP